MNKSEYTTDKIISVKQPRDYTMPLVVSSPHSGRNYPATFIATSALTPLRLRSSEDSFVDEIFGCAPELGASFIQALFPRVFIDVNRQPFELDQTMFSEPLPDYVTTRNSRIASGLGTIARVVSNNEKVYREKLNFSDAENRINYYYRPYHEALESLIDKTKKHFGFCILLDCHSMPSGAIEPKRPLQTTTRKPIDIVLGDCHGTSCHPNIMNSAVEHLSNSGFSVRKNIPYAGGFITRNYGKPKEDVHTLQIELNRALYMDEYNIERLSEIKVLTKEMTNFMRRIGEIFNPKKDSEEAAE